jgi:hypothetical protein
MQEPPSQYAVMTLERKALGAARQKKRVHARLLTCLCGMRLQLRVRPRVSETGAHVRWHSRLLFLLRLRHR